MSAFVLEDKRKRENCKEQQSPGVDTNVQNMKRSLFHDVRVDYNLNKPKATGASDAPLKREYTLTQDNNAPIQGYWDEDEFPCNAHNLEYVKGFVSGLKRPHFYHGMRNHLAERTKQAPIRHYRLEDGMVQEEETMGYYCPRCHGLYELQFMDCAHITNWKDFLIAKGVRKVSEAEEEYNNVQNLQLECRACNQSHKYENDFLKERTNILAELYYRIEDFLEKNGQYVGLDLYQEFVDAVFGCPMPTASALGEYFSNAFGLGKGGTGVLLDKIKEEIDRVFRTLNYDYETLEDTTEVELL